MSSVGRKGFTLVELLVSAGLLALMLGVALMSFSQGTRGADSLSVVQVVTEKFKAARQTAIMRATPVAVVVPAGSVPHAQSVYTVEGSFRPRVTAVANFGVEHPETVLFAGAWNLDPTQLLDPTSANSAGPLDSGSHLQGFVFADWQPPVPADLHFVFTPTGAVVTNSAVHFDGSYHLVIAQGVEYSNMSLGGLPTFRLERAAKPYTISITPAGDISYQSGVAAASTVLVDSTPINTAGAPNNPPPIAVPGNLNPQIDSLVVTPEPVPATLPPGIDATVDLRGFLSLEVEATDDDGDPLFCTWQADGGVFSSTVEERMIWRDGRWRSRWQWQVPPGAAVGDEFVLQTTVRDPRGGSDTGLVGVSGRILVIDDPKIVFSSNVDGDYDLYLMNGDGTETRQLFDLPGDQEWPEFSSDGTRIAYISDVSGRPQLYVCNRDGSDIRQVSNAPAPWEALNPSWTPDGSRLVYSWRDPAGGTQSYVVGADGNGQQQIMNHPGDGYIGTDPHPDGQRILTWYGGGIGADDLMEIDTAGNELGPVGNANTGADEELGGFSPDGQWLFVRSSSSGTYDIYVGPYTPGGPGAPGSVTGLVNVTNQGGVASTEWSPDSQQLLFRAGGGVYVVNRDGSGKRLMHTGAVNGFSWSR